MITALSQILLLTYLLTYIQMVV